MTRKTTKRTSYTQRRGGRMSAQAASRTVTDHRAVILNDLDRDGFALVNSKARAAVRSMRALERRGIVVVVSDRERPFVGVPTHYRVERA